MAPLVFWSRSVKKSRNQSLVVLSGTSCFYLCSAPMSITISICLLLWYFVKKFQFPGPSGLGKIISAYYDQSKTHFQSVLKIISGMFVYFLQISQLSLSLKQYFRFRLVQPVQKSFPVSPEILFQECLFTLSMLLTTETIFQACISGS